MPGTSSKRSIANTLLAVCVLILLFVVWLATDKDQHSLFSVSGIAPSEIDYIKLRVSGTEKARLRKVNNRWEITSPIVTIAHSDRISNLLDILSEQSPIKYSITDHALEEFGLTNPSAEIKLNDHKILFGMQHPFNGRRYILLNDSIYLVSDTRYLLITSNLGSLVAAQVLPDSKDPVAFEINGHKIAQQIDQRWLVNDTSVVPDIKALQDWIEQWRNAEAILIETSEFVPKDANNNITIHYSNGQTIRFYTAPDANQSVLYNHNLHLKYTLDKTTFSNLTRPPTLSKT